ncbi:hypothetical protein [Terrabacter lapilli]
MARMTPSEAAAVNVLISYIAGKDPNPPPEVVRSLRILASRAYNRLQGGWHEDAVQKHWPYAFEDVPRASSSPSDPPMGASAPTNSA